MGSRKRVVFFAEAVTLAHIARPVTLARGLDAARFDITLAWHPRYSSLFNNFPFPEREIRSIEIPAFLATLSSGRPSYSVETLKGYVEDDLRILDDLKPDIVVGDFRLSLSVSARLRKIPYVNITNAYWSPYAQVLIPAPDVPPFSWLPRVLAQPLFDAIKPLAFARNARPMLELHRAFGVKTPPADVRAAYTFADYVAYVDVPALIPMDHVPPTHKFIGPVFWSPDCALPAWWGSLHTETRPVVYVTLGSSGMEATLPSVVSALGKLPIRGIVASAGKLWHGNLPSNIEMVDFIAGDLAAQKAQLVICNGGSPTAYQALNAGKPVLGICTNLDQQLNMATICAVGAGKSMTASSAKADRIRSTVADMLSRPALTVAAERLRVAIASYDSTKLFEQFLLQT